MKNLLILMLLILSTSGAVFSQVPPAMANASMANLVKSGKIKGKIIDAETKTPMEYANIAIYSKQDARLVSGGIANESGVF